MKKKNEKSGAKTPTKLGSGLKALLSTTTNKKKDKIKSSNIEDDLNNSTTFSDRSKSSKRSKSRHKDDGKSDDGHSVSHSTKSKSRKSKTPKKQKDEASIAKALMSSKKKNTTGSVISTSNADNFDGNSAKKISKIVDIGLGDQKNESIDEMFHKYDHLKPVMSTGLSNLAGIKPPPLRMKPDAPNPQVQNNNLIDVEIAPTPVENYQQDETVFENSRIKSSNGSTKKPKPDLADNMPAITFENQVPEKFYDEEEILYPNARIDKDSVKQYINHLVLDKYSKNWPKADGQLRGTPPSKNYFYKEELKKPKFKRKLPSKFSKTKKQEEKDVKKEIEKEQRQKSKRNIEITPKAESKKIEPNQKVPDIKKASPNSLTVNPPPTQVANKAGVSPPPIKTEAKAGVKPPPLKVENKAGVSPPSIKEKPNIKTEIYIKEEVDLDKDFCIQLNEEFTNEYSGVLRTFKAVIDDKQIKMMYNGDKKTKLKAPTEIFTCVQTAKLLSGENARVDIFVNGEDFLKEDGLKINVKEKIKLKGYMYDINTIRIINKKEKYDFVRKVVKPGGKPPKEEKTVSPTLPKLSVQEKLAKMSNFMNMLNEGKPREKTPEPVEVKEEVKEEIEEVKEEPPKEEVKAPLKIEVKVEPKKPPAKTQPPKTVPNDELPKAGLIASLTSLMNNKKPPPLSKDLLARRDKPADTKPTNNVAKSPDKKPPQTSKSPIKTEPKPPIKTPDPKQKSNAKVDPKPITPPKTPEKVDPKSKSVSKPPAKDKPTKPKDKAPSGIEASPFGLKTLQAQTSKHTKNVDTAQKNMSEEDQKKADPVNVLKKVNDEIKNAILNKEPVKSFPSQEDKEAEQARIRKEREEKEKAAKLANAQLKLEIQRKIDAGENVDDLLSDEEVEEENKLSKLSGMFAATAKVIQDTDKGSASKTPDKKNLPDKKNDPKNTKSTSPAPNKQPPNSKNTNNAAKTNTTPPPNKPVANTKDQKPSNTKDQKPSNTKDQKPLPDNSKKPVPTTTQKPPESKDKKPAPTTTQKPSNQSPTKITPASNQKIDKNKTPEKPKEEELTGIALIKSLFQPKAGTPAKTNVLEKIVEAKGNQDPVKKWPTAKEKQAKEAEEKKRKADEEKKRKEEEKRLKEEQERLEREKREAEEKRRLDELKAKIIKEKHPELTNQTKESPVTKFVIANILKAEAGKNAKDEDLAKILNT